jgi:Region found in RelA / SpoT proteins
LDDALAVINNWRSSHSFPLNTFQVGLRIKGKQVDKKCLVAQRIKRLSSIELKLRRFKWLKLSDVQDIAGCRAVLSSVRRVDELVDVYKNSDLKHTISDQDDYIRTPKKSGYRGIHLIYRYHSDKKETYNGLKIEMQFRSLLQHAWATAVETVGTFIHHALKSSQGDKEWLRFFALVASAFALREKTPIVPGTPTTRKELIQELRDYANRLDVETRLSAYGAAMQTLEQPDSFLEAHYFLLALDSAAKRVTITGFRANQLEGASQKYLDVERSIAGQPGAEAVLVSVESLASLRRAYPNYFLDTRVFISALNRALEG